MKPGALAGIFSVVLVPPAEEAAGLDLLLWYRALAITLPVGRLALNSLHATSSAADLVRSLLRTGMGIEITGPCPSPRLVVLAAFVACESEFSDGVADEVGTECATCLLSSLLSWALTASSWSSVTLSSRSSSFLLFVFKLDFEAVVAGLL